MFSIARTIIHPPRRIGSALAGLLLTWRAWRRRRRQRRATIDLIHASPHLLADLGLSARHSRDRQP